MMKKNFLKKAVTMLTVAGVLAGAVISNGITAKAEGFDDYKIGEQVKETFTYEKEVFLYKF